MKTFEWHGFIRIWAMSSIGAVIGNALRQRKNDGDVALGIAQGIVDAILFAVVLACLWLWG